MSDTNYTINFPSSMQVTAPDDSKEFIRTTAMMCMAFCDVTDLTKIDEYAKNSVVAAIALHKYLMENGMFNNKY